jgi:hypothetical protein
MNVVMTGEGRFVEVQGTAEGEALRPRPARRAARPRRRRHRHEIAELQRRVVAVPPGPRRAVIRLVLATANPHKAAEIAAILGPAVELDAPPPQRARRGGGRRHPGGQRPAQGGAIAGPPARPRSPTTPASRSMPWVAHPACTRPATRARRRRCRQRPAPARRARRGGGRRRRGAHGPVPHCGRGPPSRWHRDGRRGPSRAHRHRMRGADTASATTRCSSPTTATAAPSPR